MMITATGVHFLFSQEVSEPKAMRRCGIRPTAADNPRDYSAHIRRSLLRDKTRECVFIFRVSTRAIECSIAVPPAGYIRGFNFIPDFGAYRISRCCF